MKVKHYHREYDSYKTERQWALEGFLVAENVEGIELLPSKQSKQPCKYYKPDEVRPATESEQEKRERELEEAKWCAVEAYKKKIEELSMVINALDNDPSTAIAMNFEATGYEYGDELLQLSIINFKGDILFNSYFKPKKHKEWTKTEKENGITPEMVANAPQTSDMANQIVAIFNKANLVLHNNQNYFDYLFYDNNIIFQQKYREKINVNKILSKCDNFELPKDSLEKCQAILKIYKEKLHWIEEDK